MSVVYILSALLAAWVICLLFTSKKPNPKLPDRYKFDYSSYVLEEDDPAQQIRLEDEDEWNYRQTHKSRKGY